MSLAEFIDSTRPLNAKKARRAGNATAGELAGSGGGPPAAGNIVRACVDITLI